MDIPEDGRKLFAAISDTYSHFDEDRALLDRSLSLSSAEFSEQSRQLREAKEKVEEIVKERTQELQETQARLLASIESLSLGFVILELNGEIFLRNTMFTALLGGKEAASILAVDSLHDGKINLESLFKEAVDKKQPTVHKAIPFENKFLRIFTTPISLNSSQQLIGAVMIIEDATKEQQIDRAKSEFVTLASHQLRTPLTIIRWHLEAMRKIMGQDAPKRVLNSLTHIDEGTKRMVALVRALLNVSHIEVGKLAIVPKPLDVVALLQTVVDELQPDIDEKKIVIKKAYEPNLPPIMADVNLFTVILENLLTNAVKYSPEGATIAIDVKLKPGNEIPNCPKPEDHFFLISVSDMGYGIPKEEQSKIFTKMYRADNIKLLKVSGTGLGLYITKAVVEICGGVIWFKSPTEKIPAGVNNLPGSTFYVAMPEKGVAPKKGIDVIGDEENLLYS